MVFHRLSRIITLPQLIFEIREIMRPNQVFQMENYVFCITCDIHNYIFFPPIGSENVVRMFYSFLCETTALLIKE